MSRYDGVKYGAGGRPYVEPPTPKKNKKEVLSEVINEESTDLKTEQDSNDGIKTSRGKKKKNEKV